MTGLVLFSGDHNQALTLIDQADLAASTKRKYSAVLGDYLSNGGRLGDAVGLRTYADTLSKSRRALLKAAVKLWADFMITDVQSRATPETVHIVDATIHRLTAVQKAIKVSASKGEKAHTWLSRPQVTQLMDAARAKEGTIGRRDVIALALLLGAGLRRNEAVSLTFEDVKRQPVKGRDRVVLSITGKGDKDRVIPVSDKLADMLTAWQEETGGGAVLRSVTKGGEIGAALSAVGLFQIVRGYGREIGFPDLAPHDLRRTYAQIGYESGVPITQISKLLGHASVQTTQRYLNLDLDLETTISDFIPL